MKKILLLVITSITLLSCKETPTKKSKNKTPFPEHLSKVFEMHGGIDKWKELRQLSFDKGNEKHLVDLQSRKSLITSDNYTIGNNGKDVWLQQKDSTSFRGNKDFYHNLFFYFYAMPFVLADDGITYEEATPLTFENIYYPGFKISYKANVGSSPDDNYYLYYNPKSYKMEWLAYSVTYFSKKASDKTNLIRYNDWVNVDGFTLPKSINWYKKDENNIPIEPAGAPMIFSNQKVSTKKLDDSLFNQPKE